MKIDISAYSENERANSKVVAIRLNGGDVLLQTIYNQIKGSLFKAV